MHRKLVVLLLVLIIIGSLYAGITINRKYRTYADYNNKYTEIKVVLDNLSSDIQSYKTFPLSQEERKSLINNFNTAKELIVIQVVAFKKPIDMDTKIFYEFANKINATFMYFTNTLEHKPHKWDQKYYNSVCFLIQKINEAIDIDEKSNYGNNKTMKEAMELMDAYITLL